MLYEHRELEAFDRAWDRQTLTSAEYAAKYRRKSNNSGIVFLLFAIAILAVAVTFFSQGKAKNISIHPSPAITDKK